MTEHNFDILWCEYYKNQNVPKTELQNKLNSSLIKKAKKYRIIQFKENINTWERRTIHGEKPVYRRFRYNQRTNDCAVGDIPYNFSFSNLLDQYDDKELIFCILFNIFFSSRLQQWLEEFDNHLFKTIILYIIGFKHKMIWTPNILVLIFGCYFDNNIDSNPTTKSHFCAKMVIEIIYLFCLEQISEDLQKQYDSLYTIHIKELRSEPRNINYYNSTYVNLKFQEIGELRLKIQEIQIQKEYLETFINNNIDLWSYIMDNSLESIYVFNQAENRLNFVNKRIRLIDVERRNKAKQKIRIRNSKKKRELEEYEANKTIKVLKDANTSHYQAYRDYLDRKFPGQNTKQEKLYMEYYLENESRRRHRIHMTKKATGVDDSDDSEDTKD